MNYKCDWCIHKEKSEKFFYCDECSSCTNGESEDTDNHFVPKEEYEICSNCVHCHKTKEMVDGELCQIIKSELEILKEKSQWKNK